MKRTARDSVRVRGATAAVLALALGAAVYLNWSYTREAPQGIVDTGADTAAAVETSAQGDAAAILDPLESEAEAVSAKTEELAEETANKNYGEAQLVSVNKDSGTEFFESARLARTKSRDEALEEVKKALEDASVTEEEKKTLTENLARQVDNITLETRLETLIKSKGFADCVVNLNGKAAEVTVMTENDALTAAEVTRIRDALLGACKGLEAQDITIVEVK